MGKTFSSLCFTVMVMVFFVGPSACLAITTPEAVVCNFGGTDVTIIDIASRASGAVPVGVGPSSVAITPDATQAWVTNDYSGTISVIDLASHTVQYTITLQGGAAGLSAIAIRPDNSQAWVANYATGIVSVIDIGTRSVISTIQLNGIHLESIAITPDNTQAWVCSTSGAGTVFVIDIASQHVYTLAISAPTAIAFTPDNKKAWVCSQTATGTVSVIDIGTRSVISTIDLGSSTYLRGIAIMPNNKKALVCSYTLAGGVFIIDIDSHHSDTVSVSFPQSISITPDNTQAWVTQYSGNTVSIIDIDSHHVDTVQVGKNPQGIAITPDQSPTARFTATISGSTATVDASASRSPLGGIATYAWNFGDGSPEQTTTAPQISHTYSQDGTFTITLIVTNTSGTSTTQTFTGQTVSNNGGPSAQLSQPITISTNFAPSKFVGKTKIHERAKKLFLKTKWTKSRSSTVSRYRIFAHNKKIATISARHDRQHTVRLKPQHFPHKRISKKYKRYLDGKYSIRAVNSNGTFSSSTPIHVVR